MSYKVLEFYPNLALKVRVTEHETKSEAYDVINICRNYAEVPYVAIDSRGSIFDVCTFGMKREEMARLIREEL